MVYKSVDFKLSPNQDEYVDLLIALLDAEGFEGIYQKDNSITGYIPENKYRSEDLESIQGKLHALNCELSWIIGDIPEQNWNKVWESNFDPVEIEDRCVIRAPFHAHFEKVKHQITIEPKMSFGTGHHNTTRMILQHMESADFIGKHVLDMGCGTGVLAIYAEMIGAESVVAIDYDKWAYKNTLENVARNNCQRIDVLQGSSEVIPSNKFDIILANINRNILLEQMADYAEHIKSKGLLFLSGIMIQDLETLKEGAVEKGFTCLKTYELDTWGMLIFNRN